MADPSQPLILGWDNEKQCWSEGDISARVRSVSEPDRAVPLTARMEVVPDVLDCTPDVAQTEVFRARVRVRPGAQIPTDNRARITIIADPMLEMGMQVVSAMGLPLPSASSLFKNLRASVRVEFYPYALDVELVQDGQRGPCSSEIQLEGDARSRLRVEARVRKVDGRGSILADPVAARVGVQGGLEGVVVTRIESPDVCSLELCTEKPLFGSARQAGTLTFTAELPGGRTAQRTVSVKVLALSTELSVSPSPRFRLGVEPRLTLTVTDSKRRPVSGMACHWQLEPAVGVLSAGEGSTDGQGQVTVTYRPPTLEQALQVFTGETLALEVKVRAGSEPPVVVASQALTLEFFAAMEIGVEKAGFTPQSGYRVEMLRPGGVSVLVKAAGGHNIPISQATVYGGGLTASTNSGGTATLQLGTAGPAGTVEIALELDTDSQELCNLLLRDVSTLQQAGWCSLFLSSACARMETFVRNEYVARLASEAPDQYANSFLNLKALHPVMHVGLLSVQLFERRYERFHAQISSAMGNLAGAFFTFLGEKYFPRIGAWFGDKLGRFLSYLGKRLSGQAWLLARARGAAGSLNGFLNRLQERLQKLKRQVGAKRSELPVSMDRGLDHNFELPHRPGIIQPGDEVRQALEAASKKASELRLAHESQAKLVKSAQQEVEALQGTLAGLQAASHPDPGALARLQQELSLSGQRLQSASEAAARSQVAAEEAEQAAKAAQAGWEDMKGMCSALDELLGSFMRALSTIYEYGAWLLAYLTLRLGSAFMTSMRKVMNGVHPGAPQSLDNAVQDLVSKKAFTTAFEMGGYYLVGPAIRTGLLIYQGYAVAVAVEEAQSLSARWEPRDLEGMKAALRWYYEEIEAASFKIEEQEVWTDLGAELLDWLEYLMVWLTRIVNLLLGVAGAVVSFLTMGAGLPAWLLVSAAFTAFMEALDRFWDAIKAVCSSVRALAGAAEVVGVVLPAHAVFTARLYGDPGLQERVQRAWTFDVGPDLQQKLETYRKPGTYPGEQILTALNDKLSELGTQLEGALP